MKKYIITLAASLLMLFTINTASNAETFEKQSNVGNYLMSNIRFPFNFLNDNEETFVLVSIKVNEEGKIEVLASNAVNKEIGDYVVRNISKIKPDENILKQGVTYNVKLIFKTL